MYDRGRGPALVLVPGIQGRWEWMRPALRTLSKHFRTISYSLSGDIGSRAKMDRSRGFDTFVDQVDSVAKRCRIDRFVLCGVSYGGVIAARYAAARPERVAALILVSAPGPSWKPSERQARYAARPWRSLPAFCMTAIERLRSEIYTSHDDWKGRARFTMGYFAGAAAAPAIPALMAQRVHLQQRTDLRGDCARIVAPTLVITGEPELDRVVPVASTREYVTRIRGARYEMMPRTGHLGSITQPERFAQIVTEFVHAAHS
jgi:pimeloyl-ACP methyl ester carboxylesterase